MHFSEQIGTPQDPHLPEQKIFENHATFASRIKKYVPELNFFDFCVTTWTCSNPILNRVFSIQSWTHENWTFGKDYFSSFDFSCGNDDPENQRGRGLSVISVVNPLIRITQYSEL